MLQYDTPQEPPQPLSQSYLAHARSSTDFIHHTHQFFCQSSVGHSEMFGYYHPQHDNPSNTSFQQVPSSYTLFSSESSYSARPSHMFDTSAMTSLFAHFQTP